MNVLKIAILEDNAERIRQMQLRLKERFPQYEVVVFSGSANEMIHWLSGHFNDTLAISLDHDFELIANRDGKWVDPGTGLDVVNALCNYPPCFPVIIHSTNTTAAIAMEVALTKRGWRVERIAPYGDFEWVDAVWFPAIRKAIVDCTAKIHVQLPTTALQ